MNHEILIHIENGQVVNKIPVHQFFTELHDGSYLAKFQPRKVRTHNQNAYYFAQVVPLIREGLRDAGYDEIKSNHDAHEVLKTLFHKKEVVNKHSGEIIATLPGSTTEMSTTEFKDYLEAIGKWAAEYLGIEIPPPGVQLTIHK